MTGEKSGYETRKLRREAPVRCASANCHGIEKKTLAYITHVVPLFFNIIFVIWKSMRGIGKLTETRFSDQFKLVRSLSFIKQCSTFHKCKIANQIYDGGGNWKGNSVEIAME